MKNNHFLFNVVIEIAMGERDVKYEINHEDGHIYVDRFYTAAFFSPCNYGFVPNSLAGDGDPQDVLVITPFKLELRSIIQCRTIGALAMADESGLDDKIIAVPSPKVTSLYDNVHELSDIHPSLLAKIKHFFVHYKDLDSAAFVSVGNFLSAATAEEIIKAALANNNLQ